MNTLFHSRWSDQLAGFVRFKQDLGHPYRRSIATLHSFDHFATNTPRVKKLSTVINGWAHRPSSRKAISTSNEMCTLRQFCLFCRRSDPASFVPERMFAPPSTEGAPFLPYIFTIEEIKCLLADTARVQGTSRTRQCFRMLLLVLYCTGIRIGEALSLRSQDVDLPGRCFRVGPSKGRIRWVPFHSDLGRELRSWMNVVTPDRRPDSLIFAQDNGSPRSVKAASQTLRFMFRRCGLKPKTGRVGPRCHDLRHTFAVHRLQRWYQEGRNIQQMLPWLSAYLGHRNLLGTERYLHATPELLNTASRRLRHQMLSDPVSP